MKPDYLNPTTCPLTEEDVGTILTWNRVTEYHKVRIGIYQRKGRLISLLTDFGRINPCYPDQHGETENTILYTGNGRHGDQKLDPQNRALLDAVGTEAAVPLFNKLSPGKWQFLGFWTVSDGKYAFREDQQRMVWTFRLERAR